VLKADISLRLYRHAVNGDKTQPLRKNNRYFSFLITSVPELAEQDISSLRFHRYDMSGSLWQVQQYPSAINPIDGKGASIGGLYRKRDQPQPK
jgi:hypothetical protein